MQYWQLEIRPVVNAVAPFPLPTYLLLDVTFLDGEVFVQHHELTQCARLQRYIETTDLPT